MDFAIFFAVLSAVLVVVPYFGSIAGAIPPVLFALTDSPGKGCSRWRSTRSCSSSRAMFGFVGLFVAVPILSLVVIVVEEFWVKPVEESEARRYAGTS